MEHRRPTRDHNSSRALAACYENTCEIRAAATAPEAMSYRAASGVRRPLAMSVEE